MKPSALVISYNNIGNEIKKNLQSNNFEVFLVKNCSEGLLKSEKKFFDLFLIIISKSSEDYIQTISKIKQRTAQTSLFFICENLTKKEVVSLYEAGVDDVFYGHIDLDILQIKSNNLVKKKYFFENKKTDFNFGKYSLNYKLRQLNFNNLTIARLSPRECDVLLLLINNTDEFVSKSYALQLIWKKEDYFTGKCLDVYINKLRKHFSQDKTIKIENIRQNGFRLLVQ